MLVALVLSVLQPLAPQAAVTTIKSNELSNESEASVKAAKKAFAAKLAGVKNERTKSAIMALAPKGYLEEKKVPRLTADKSVSATAADTIVQFDDVNLENAITSQLGFEEGTPITVANMESLTEIWAYEANISDLTGLEYAINLQFLIVTSNNIQDLTPISQLKNLQYVDFSYNHVDSLDGVANLTSLVSIGFSYTKVSDLSTLLNLPLLTEAVCVGLDIDWDHDASAIAVVKTLAEKGITVYYLPFAFYEVISSESAISINYVYLGKARSENIKVQISVDGEVKQFVNLYEEEPRFVIRDLQPDTEYTFELKAFENGVLVDEKPTTKVIKTDLAPSGEVVNFDDVMLEEAIKESLLVENRDIRESDMVKLVHLELAEKGITSLKGLEAATNLQYLSAPVNAISDFSPLAGLTKLVDLDVSENGITDLEPLSKLVNLTSLYLNGNMIEDLTPLKDLKNLTALSLMNNGLEDITPLKYLTKLMYLDLDFNSVVDITSLASLSELETVWLSENQVKNILPLKYLSKLVYVSLDKNPLDLSEGSVARQVLSYLEEHNENFTYTITLLEIKKIMAGDRVVAIDWDSAAVNADEFHVFIEEQYYDEEEYTEEEYTEEEYDDEDYGYEPIVVSKNQTHYVFTGLEPNKEYAIWVEAVKDDEIIASEYASANTTEKADLKGFFALDGYKYYYDAAAKKLKTGWIQDQNKWYYLEKGAFKTGLAVINKKSYLFDSKGVMLTGWQTIGSNKYYFDLKNGAMVKGFLTISGKKYYFGDNGALVKGWKQISGKWYFFDNYGVAKTGWLKSGKDWYYLDASGVMKTGWVKVSGKWYYLKSNGAMKTGWLSDGGQWYYLNTDGTMAIGWKKISNKWYYFYSDGKMAKSTTINGYRLGKDGAML